MASLNWLELTSRRARKHVAAHDRRTRNRPPRSRGPERFWCGNWRYSALIASHLVWKLPPRWHRDADAISSSWFGTGNGTDNLNTRRRFHREIKVLCPWGRDVGRIECTKSNFRTSEEPWVYVPPLSKGLPRAVAVRSFVEWRPSATSPFTTPKNTTADQKESGRRQTSSFLNAIKWKKLY